MNDIYSSKESTYSSLLAKATEITQNITEAIKNKLNFQLTNTNSSIDEENIDEINKLTFKINVHPDNSLGIDIHELGYSKEVIKAFEENNVKTISNIYDGIAVLVKSNNRKYESAIIELFEFCIKHNPQQLTKFLSLKDGEKSNLLGASIDMKMIKLPTWILSHKEILNDKIINNVNKNKNTALFLASYHNLYSIVAKLLEYPNIEVNVFNNYGESALFHAVLKNNERVALLLLSHPKINIKYIVDKKLLNSALLHSSEGIALNLLEKINSSEYYEHLFELNTCLETLLIVGCKKKYVIFVSQLLEELAKHPKHFNPDYINKFDIACKTALDYCLYNQLFDVATKIIGTGHVDCTIHFNNELISIAEKSEFNTMTRFIGAKQYELIDKLIVVPIDYKEITPKILIEEMLYVCAQKEIDILYKMLVTYKIENYAMYCDSHHNTILMYASMYQWYEACLYILIKEDKTELFFKNKGGKSTLMLLCETNIFDLITRAFDKIIVSELILNSDNLKHYAQCVEIIKKNKDQKTIKYIGNHELIIKNEIKILEYNEMLRTEQVIKELNSMDNNKKKSKSAKKKEKKKINKLTQESNSNGELKNDFKSEEEEIDCDDLILNSSFNKNPISKDAKKDVKQEVKQETKLEVKQETKPEIKQEIKLEVKQEVKKEIKLEVKQETKPDKYIKNIVVNEVKKDVKQEVKQDIKKEVKQ
jgi:ankyrin repeat protein